MPQEERSQQKQPPLSPEMKRLLEEQSGEAEILAAMDAALEEGIRLSREEIIEMLRKKRSQLKQP